MTTLCGAHPFYNWALYRYPLTQVIPELCFDKRNYADCGKRHKVRQCLSCDDGVYKPAENGVRYTHCLTSTRNTAAYTPV